MENPTSRFPQAREFLFKHALVRDVAYASAGDDLKKQLHASAARWLHGPMRMWQGTRSCSRTRRVAFRYPSAHPPITITGQAILE